jgi:Rieske 2Fe-2S family protein
VSVQPRPSRAGLEPSLLSGCFEPYPLKHDFDAPDTSGFWDPVNRQDRALCEAARQGMGARAHPRGYYAPMEDFSLDIRRDMPPRIGDLVGAA